MNIFLPTDLEEFVQRQICCAAYASARDVICAALELLKKQQAEKVEEELCGEITPEEIDRLKEFKLIPLR